MSVNNMDGAIEAIYRLHFPSLTWYVMNNSGTREDAEDIFQEVIIAFIRLVQENKFRGEASIGTFLYSMNRNAWLNELKRRSRALVREERFETGKDTQIVDISHFIADRESKSQLHNLIVQLGENCQKILTLFYFEERSLKDILTSLDYENEQVVRNKKYKCMKQLREMIDAIPSVAQVLKNMMHG